MRDIRIIRKEIEMKFMPYIGFVSSLSLIAVLGLTSCSGDDEAIQSQSKGTPQKLTLITSLAPFFDVQRMDTRALPAGYVAYNELYPTTTPPNTTIGVFMTPERADAISDFIYAGYDDQGHPTNQWTSTVTITEGTQYYIYGFMPKEDAANASITDLNGNGPNDSGVDWSLGAKMQLQMNTVTPADVCLIVGVKKYEPATIPPPAIEETGIQLGQFSYMGGPRSTNFVYLLLKHIYSALHFKMSLDATYASLRTIKVTQVELIADAALSNTIDLDITLTANDNGLDPVPDGSITYTPTSGGSTTAAAVIFPWTGGPTNFELPIYPNYSDHIGCFAPNSCQSLTLRTTFDVYDKQGNLTRKSAVADNKINVEAAELKAGESLTVNLLVKPTYLYVLSDPDLDNPTITISN